MKKILFILSILFVFSLVISEDSRDVFTDSIDSIGWYHYEVDHKIKVDLTDAEVDMHNKTSGQNYGYGELYNDNWHTEMWRSKSNENEWHIYTPEELKEKQGDRQIISGCPYVLNSIDTLTYPNDGYYIQGYRYNIGPDAVILIRQIRLIKSPNIILDVFTVVLENENTMTKFFIFCLIFCLIGYITALKRTKIDPDLIVIKGGWDYFWLALPYVMFITCLLLDVPFSGFMFLGILIPSIGLLVKSIMHNKAAENIFLSFISKIFVIIILVLIVFMFFGGTKKDGRFKDGTKDNQSTTNKVIAGGIAYGLILSLIHGSSAWKNEFKGKLKK